MDQTIYPSHLRIFYQHHGSVMGYSIDTYWIQSPTFRGHPWGETNSTFRCVKGWNFLDARTKKRIFWISKHLQLDKIATAYSLIRVCMGLYGPFRINRWVSPIPESNHPFFGYLWLAYITRLNHRKSPAWKLQPIWDSCHNRNNPLLRGLIILKPNTIQSPWVSSESHWSCHWASSVRRSECR